MKRIVPILGLMLAVTAMAFLFPSFALATGKPAKPAKTPRVAPRPDRVVALYFHRTKRCPTCRKMGSYTEEAIKKGFAKPLKKGEVEFFYIDFQDKKNAKLTKGYKIKGPTLIVARIKGNKVKEFKNLKEMWTKVGEKKAFLRYVRENVKAYMTERKRETTAANNRASAAQDNNEKRSGAKIEGR
jgi:hypothetical protein